MIYTYTLNPALDCITWAPTLQEGGLSRAYRQEILPGGKGVNVAAVLTGLGHLCEARGFAAGFTGDALLAGLTAQGIRHDFQRLSEGQTRVNMKLKTGRMDAPTETEINGPGPCPGEEDLEKLFVRMSFLKPDDWVILSGSLPPGVQPSLYSRMVRAANAKGARCVVDASGRALHWALPAHPWLVKPNRAELAELVGEPMDTLEELHRGAEWVRSRTGGHVLVSLGGEGAVLLTAGGEFWHQPPTPGTVVNTVGAGDSMVAGFVAMSLAPRSRLHTALMYSAACGAATAFTEGLADHRGIVAAARLTPPPQRLA